MLRKMSTAMSEFNKMLIERCEIGDKGDLLMLIKANADVNHRNKDGNTGLHCACRNGHVECVRLHIESTADVHLRDDYGDTGLALAAKYGQPKCLELMIEAKADVNHQNKKDTSAVNWACRGGHVECVRLLVESKADVYLYDEDAVSGLEVAAGKGKLECLKVMIDAKVDVNRLPYRGSVVGLAGAGGHVECVQLLLEHKADVNLGDDEGLTGLMQCADGGSFECLKLAIDAKADVNQEDEYYATALHWVSYREGRNVECVRLLIEHKADVHHKDIMNKTCLIMAVEEGGREGFRVVLDAVTSTDDPRVQTTLADALVAAVRANRDDEILIPLFQAGAIIRDDDERSSDDDEPPLSDVERDRLVAARRRWKDTLGFASEFGAVANNTLSYLVNVDTRVGLGDNGLYQEPLERVMGYLGLTVAPLRKLRDVLSPGAQNAAHWATQRGQV